MTEVRQKLKEKGEGAEGTEEKRSSLKLSCTEKKRRLRKGVIQRFAQTELRVDEREARR